MGRKQQDYPLTFILRTPASPWIPTETGPCHIPALVMPPRGDRAIGTLQGPEGDIKGPLLTQPQLHLVLSQLERGLRSWDAAGRQAEAQGTCAGGNALLKLGGVLGFRGWATQNSIPMG